MLLTHMAAKHGNRRSVRDVRRAVALAVCAGVVALAMMLAAATVTQAQAQPQPQPHKQAAAPSQGQGPAGQPVGCSFAVVSTPNTGPLNDLRATAALAPNDVWAVGVYYDPDSGNMPKTLIEHWDGTAWTVVTSPSPGLQVNELNDVAGVSSGDVWAVGEYQPDGGSFPQTLVEHWNGAAWSVVPSINLGISGSFLYGVTAVDANHAWAVGYYPQGSTDFPLIEYWDGSAWLYWAGPTPTLGGQLKDVSGISAGDVWAVGFYIDTGFVSKTLVEHWDGTAWNIVASPNPQPIANNLTGVSMLSANDVWAVGNDVDTNSVGRTLVEHWDGNEWSVVASPNQGTFANELLGVSALSATDVWATGSYNSNGSGHNRTLLEHWDGSTWSVVSGADPGTDTNLLEGISGLGAGDVWAVGNYAQPNAGFLTLAEHWDGTSWSEVPSPNPGRVANVLASVSAVSANDVWAVGSGTNVVTGLFRSLVEHWDGTQWSIVQDPAQGLPSATLTGVDALAADDSWAVGNYSDHTTGRYETLMEHWNGAAWSVVASPNVASSDNFLNGVSARTSNDVWAVGQYSANGSSSTLVERWDGTQWSIVPSADTGVLDILLAVAAISPSDVWAVGTFSLLSADIAGHALVEHWDGAAWSVVSTPDPNEGYLDSVTALAAGDVWAVGHYSGGSVHNTLVEHWDGTRWSTVPSPSPGSTQNELAGIAAVSSNDVWAVGLSFTRTAIVQPLVEHWNGSAWSVAPSESEGAGGSVLTSVSPVGANDVWAVGEYQFSSASNSETMAEHYSCAPCTLQFEDVLPGSTFYPFVRCMACQGIISGYQCGTTGEPCNPTHDPYFRPNANVTRGQIAKIVALSSGNHSPVSGQSFHDVPPGSTFYTYTEQLAALGVMSGYPCGGAGEPCGPGNLPYFRPNSSATRGQLSKIDANAAGYHDTPTGRQFQDVAPASTFYTYTYALVSRSIMAGYTCGGTGEPCGPGNLPYFRPNNQVTRGQTAKIVGNTFFPDCQTP